MLWVKCASVLTIQFKTTILTCFSLVTLLPVKADIYRNFLLQVPSAQTDMIDAEFFGFCKSRFALLDKSSWHSNFSSMGQVTEYSGYIVGRHSCGTCWGCHSSEPLSLHVSQTLQCQQIISPGLLKQRPWFCFTCKPHRLLQNERSLP